MGEDQLLEFALALKNAAGDRVASEPAAARLRCATRTRHLAVLALMAAESWTIDQAQIHLETDADLRAALGLQLDGSRVALFADLRLLGDAELARLRPIIGVDALLANVTSAARRKVHTQVAADPVSQRTPPAELVAVTAPRPSDQHEAPRQAAALEAASRPREAFVLAAPRDRLPAPPPAVTTPAHSPESPAPAAPAPPSPHAASDEPHHIAIPARPKLADDVRLLGVMPDSGYEQQQWLVQRSGRYIQVTELLYSIAQLADGQHSLDEIAVEVARATGRPVSTSNVAQLIGARLLPLGIIAGPAAPVALASRSPLQVGLHAAVIGPRVIDRVTSVLRFLCTFPFVAAALVMTVVTQWWLFFQHDVTLSFKELVVRPYLILVLVPLIVLGVLFHEFGHASALRQAGGRARKIGFGFYLMYPVFYTDITESYRLKRWARVGTDLGGFYFNAIFMLAVFGVYALTHYEFLLALMVMTDLDILNQCLPIVRFDGYWAFADLVGIPDWFTLVPAYLHDAARRILPWRRNDRALLPALKPWVRTVFGLYLVLTIPLLIGMLVLLVLAAPALLTATLASGFAQVKLLVPAWQGADVLQAATAILELLILALTLVGLVAALFVLGQAGVRALWRWGARSRWRRVSALALTVMSAALLLVYWAAPLAVQVRNAYVGVFPASAAPPAPTRQSGGATAQPAQPALVKAPQDAQPAVCTNSVAFARTTGSSARIVPGVPIAFTATFAVHCAKTGLVDFEVYDASGNKVWQSWLDDQPFTGSVQTVSMRWTPPPALTAAWYQLAVGVFEPGWGALYGWEWGTVLYPHGTNTGCTAVPGAPGAHQLSSALPASRGIFTLAASYPWSCPTAPSDSAFQVADSSGSTDRTNQPVGWVADNGLVRL